MDELKVTLFRWLVHNNSLSCLEEQCDSLWSGIQRVYRLVLPLDVPELLDYSGTLKILYIMIRVKIRHYDEKENVNCLEAARISAFLVT